MTKPTESGHEMAGLVEALTEAHLNGSVFPVASGAIPLSVSQAAEVQAGVAKRLGAAIAGWKLGVAPAEDIAVSAPLFRHLILPDGASYARGSATFVAIEAEIGFYLERDVAPTDPTSALGAAFVGIEVVRSRFVEAAKAPYLAFLADNIGNGAYVVGPQRRDWRNIDLNGLRCRVWIDNRLVHDAVGGHPQGDPLAVLRACAARPIDRLGGLRAGQVITTGTLCGVLPVQAPCVIRVDLDHFGEVGVCISA